MQILNSGRRESRRAGGAWLAVFALTAAVGCAQSSSESEQFGRASFEFGGARLYNVSVFSGYSSSAAGLTASGTSIGSVLNEPGVGFDVDVGASALAGWQHHTERTDATVMYSGTYLRTFRYSAITSFNETLNASLSRKLSERWSLSVTAAIQDLTTTQFLVQSSPAGLATELAGSLDDLAAASSVGQFSSSQVASILTGALSLQNPAGTVLLGNRMLTATGQMSLHYAMTPRLSFNIGGFTAGGERLVQSGQGIPNQPDVLLPHTVGVNGQVGFSYSLSPRTDLGIDGGMNWTTNRFQNAYIETASVSLGRKMGEHWFVQLHGGSAETRFQGNSETPMLQATGGGSLGVHTYRNALIASYDRAASDSFGIAVGTSTVISGAWTFHSPSSRWSLTSTFRQEQLRNTGFVSLSGWLFSSSFMRQMGPHTSLSTQYSYLKATGATGDSQGTPTDESYQSVRLSATWSPLPSK